MIRRDASPMQTFPTTTRSILAAACLLLGACIEADSGPDLGACAVVPKGAYGYGEIGIGTCIAGPADMQFVERDGAPWLAITNADPFRNFDSGSLLLIDWNSVLERVDAGAPRRITVDTLTTESVPNEHFVGAIGWVPDKELLLVNRRLTADGRTRVGRDSAYVYDLADLTTTPARLQLEDDPGDIVVTSDGRVFVLNFTDHSISVFDAQVGSDAPILPIDLAPEASFEARELDDADQSGSVAELERLAVLDSTLLSDDLWTLEYLPGQFRAWVPGADDTLDRFSTGGLGWVPTGISDPLDFSFIYEGTHDFVASFQAVQTTDADQTLELLYADGSGIRSTTNAGIGEVDLWQFNPGVLLAGNPDPAGWDVSIGGPSRAFATGTDALFYDGANTPDGDRSIGVALLNLQNQFVPLAVPILTPDPGQSFEQPFVQLDENTNTARMWLSVYDGTRYAIGYTSSEDGLSFPDPEIVLALPDQSIAAPVVRHQDGRYHLWASVWDGVSWSHVTATSPDGLEWSALEPFVDSEASFDPRRPPRVAVHGSPSSVWRIEGTDEGVVGARITPGVRFVDINHGYALGISGGQELHRSALFPLGRASAGVVPTSVVDFTDFDRVFVTIEDAAGRKRIAAIDHDRAGHWDVANPDVFARGDGGNELGVSSPLVFERQGVFAMYYTAHGLDGVSRVRAATSADGRTFTPVGGALLDPEVFGSWLDAEQEAHSIEFADDGTVRLFLSGNDGSRWRIGAVAAGSLDPASPETVTWRLDRGRFDADVQLSAGLPGGVDDSGVRDPAIVNTLQGRFLYYSGFDGNRWHLAKATWDGVDWVRRTQETTDITLPAMSGTSRTFSTGGVFSPVVRSRPGGVADVWYAGTDDPTDDLGIPQLGLARARGEAIFPEFRMPSAGDTISYATRRGDDRISVIELSQDVRSFFTTGTGTTSMILDEERGFLYVPSKLSDLLYVVDIRDDSREGFIDANVYDLETVVSFPTVGNNVGFRGGVVIPGQDRVVFTTRNPDTLVWLDLTAVEDNAIKETTRLAFVATQPLQDSAQDVGPESVAQIGGAEPTLHGNLLFVPHFRDNSMSVFDLRLGPNGEEIAYIPSLGENPHIVSISPEGRFAVVANYTGEVDEGLTQSSLALVDLDPSSPAYLTVAHRIVNR